MGAPIHIVGERYGRYVVLAQRGGKSDCRCDCGTEKTVETGSLRCGATRSCGCLNKELASARAKTHGQSETPEFGIWEHIITRCENTASPDYPEYGGRGITIAPEWRHSFAAFIEHVGPRPTKGHSIDRKDNSLGYVPGNVRWATAKEQARNTRRNRYLTLNGETLILTDWAARTGLSNSLISKRIKGLGWSVEKALSTPARTTKKPKEEATAQ